MSGPDQGVRLSTGQVIEIRPGAGAVPSEMTMTEMSAGTLTTKVNSFSRVNSASHRSEPWGSGTLDSAPGTTVFFRVDVSGSISSLLYEVSPTQASTSLVLP